MNARYDAVVEALKAAIDAAIEMEKLPVRYLKMRSGWAAYKGTTRITKFYFPRRALGKRRSSGKPRM